MVAGFSRVNSTPSRAHHRSLIDHDALQECRRLRDFDDTFRTDRSRPIARRTRKAVADGTNRDRIREHAEGRACYWTTSNMGFAAPPTDSRRRHENWTVTWSRC